MRDFQELADEAFADLLRKHGRPVDLKTALRQSVGEIEKRPATPLRSGAATLRGRPVGASEAIMGVRTRGLDMQAGFKRDAADRTAPRRGRGPSFSAGRTARPQP